MDGALLVNKPRGMTSHDVVAVARHALAIPRIGHTGTLDPMAEGLLVLLIGRATKRQQAFQGHDKTYEATIRLGVKTDTADAEGAVIESSTVPAFERAKIIQVLASFEGPLDQVPPAFSAVKVRGKPAYWWARRQKPVALSSRRVAVHALSLLAFDGATMDIRVSCSAGTYVRTLAEMIAQRLGTLGHLTRLTRQSVGCWSLDEAVSISFLKTASTNEILSRVIAVDTEPACLPA